MEFQFGGNAVKVGEEEYTLFRDHEYVESFIVMNDTNSLPASWPRSRSKQPENNSHTTLSRAIPTPCHVFDPIRGES